MAESGAAEPPPDVSYVVTLFNKRAFLPFLCGGLAAQRGGFRAEYVFVDDGSNDGTPELLREITASWPRVTIHVQPNAGPAAATNAGLARATGRWIKTVDGDDVLLPWATERLAAAIRATGCAAALANGPDQPAYDPAAETPEAVLGQAEPPVVPPEVTDLLPLSLKRAQSSPTHWLFERALLPRIGGTDPAVFIQDYSLELEIALATKVAVVPGAMLAIPGAAPGRLSDNEAQILHDLNAALMRFLRRHPELPRGLRNLGLKRAAFRAASWAARRGKAGPLNPASLLRIPASLGLLRPDEATERKVCAPFRETHRIRLTAASD